MPGLVPGIHVLAVRAERKTWMAGTSPAMTDSYGAVIPDAFTTVVSFS
jgi:hypothetical protein